MEYKTGEIYEEFKNVRQCEKFSFDGKSAVLVLLRKNLSEEFIRQIKENEIFFQIFTKEEIPFLLIKFEELNWLDIPIICDNNCVPEFITSENCGYKINILLADAMSGKLYINRTEALNHGLSKALFWASKEQIENPPKNIQERINKVLASFDAAEMARLSLGK